MAALSTGTLAPEFTLPTTDGNQFSLANALQRGPVVAAFFKVSCPVCQYTFPFIERLYQAYQNQGVTIVGVSQNDRKDTLRFMKEYGITFPVLLDDTKSYPASNAYGLTNVPTIFWISPDRQIEISSVGWSRADMEQINQLIANTANKRQAPLFLSGEDVADFRAG
jgi:peroxiredoxin